jgi:hypothetical protein
MFVGFKLTGECRSGAFDPKVSVHSSKGKLLVINVAACS